MSNSKLRKMIKNRTTGKEAHRPMQTAHRIFYAGRPWSLRASHLPKNEDGDEQPCQEPRIRLFYLKFVIRHK